MTILEPPPDVQVRSARYWIERNLLIKTKAGSIVPFHYNAVQERLDATLERLREQGKLQRLIVLKARQEGVSTWVEGRVYEKVRRNPFLAAFIIGNEQENSEHLYGMFELFYANDPEKLPLSRSNRKELRFQPPHSGQVLVSTAVKAHAGTGQTNQVIHVSELAKWPRAQTTMLSLLQTLPRTPNSLGIIESTAFGASGYFYDLWWDARKGLNEWEPVFLAWHDLPEYQMPIGSYFMGDLGKHPRYNVYQDQETLLQKCCTLEQLTWRRWAIDNLCGGEADVFNQEYPANDMDAFLVTGRPRFAQHILQRWLHQVRPPVFSGILDAEGQEISGEGDFIHIWYRPEKGHVYVMGCDCAEGHEGGDYQAAVVYDKTAHRQAATVHGLMEADAYAEHLARIGRHYNEALAAVEVNGCGWAVLNRLRHLYNHLYYRAPYDRAVRIPGDRIGWHTMVATKPDMIANLAEVIRDDAIEVADRETVEELMAYAYLASGTGAPEGHHDDYVMALGIALTVAGETSLGEYRHYDPQRNEGAPADSSEVQV